MLKKLLPTFLSVRYWMNSWREVSLVWRVARDPRVSIGLKVLPLLSVLYFLSPFDLIPGFIPIVGQLDDIAILLLGLKFFLRLAPDDVVADYRQQMQE